MKQIRKRSYKSATGKKELKESVQHKFRGGEGPVRNMVWRQEGFGEKVGSSTFNGKKKGNPKAVGENANRLGEKEGFMKRLNPIISGTAEKKTWSGLVVQIGGGETES